MGEIVFCCCITHMHNSALFEFIFHEHLLKVQQYNIKILIPQYL